ncbi:MAG TPA: AMP-binding protein [Tepidisphaeraceae bacterium]|jgi:acetyl-CoA synthetase
MSHAPAFIPPGEIVWRPTPELIEASQLTRFMRRNGIGTLGELMSRSTSDIAWFWDAVLKELGIRFAHPYSRVVDLTGGIERPRWCIDGQMNIIDNLLDRYAGTATDRRVAIRFEEEAGTGRTLTYAELREAVNRAANGLRSLGLKRGDVIGVCMPMVPETVVAMLAILKIGGIFLPLFSGYGAQAIASRLRDAEAKALFTADGCRRRGTLAPMKAVADEAARDVASLRHVIVLRCVGAGVPWNAGRDRWWNELFDHQSPNSPTEPTGADDPMMLLYTSGTSGRPKGAVHSYCGFPIKAAQDMLHGLDVHEDETVYWMTDMGWMMGPWLVFGTLLIGATMVLYDGAPDYPDAGRVWSLVERHRITLLGISPTLVRSLMGKGGRPVRAHDVSSLRKFGSTGEPWNATAWLWLFDVVGGGRLPILNYSGGTEISGGILSGNVHTPLKPCAFGGPLPGMAADVVDAHGRSVRGTVGELVIRQPWIGMTRGFWNDPDSRRYHDAYWPRFPGVWVHGDWAAVDSEGLWYILGRSDDTIKIAGKRLGPAEAESILAAHPKVAEAAAVGVPDPVKGEALVCFVVLRDANDGTEELRAELKQRIVNELGKPLAPREVKFARDLPKTRNAKIMRRVIRAAYLGQDPGDISALENPAAVQAVREAM